MDLELSNAALFDIEYCKDTMMEEFRDNWKQLTTLKPKLRTYVQFKSEYSTEQYVSLNLSRTQRSMLSQLRLGILPLHIETGRFVGTPAENRVCNMCSTGEVENECHFVFHCDVYEVEREDFYKTVVSRCPEFEHLQDIDKFSYLFSSEPRLFSKYVSATFSKRQNLLYSD